MGILPKSVAAIIPGNFRYPVKRFLQKSFYFGLAKVSGGRNNALLWSYGQFELSPSIILQGYMQGFYPLPNMMNHKIVDWYDPELRGVIPIHGFKAGDDLRRYFKKEKLKATDQQLEIKINTDFKGTIIACATPGGNKRVKTWLSPEYIKAALELHEMGMAHSVETYQNGVLVGGLIGLSINGYFSTLTQFHTVDNAGKVAFYYLLLKLKKDGFKLHLAGAANTWLSQYGMVTVEKEEFRADLLNALTSPAKFTQEIPELEF
jgi:leucyl/phenylalanyl-tRNA--protein transferase